MFSTLNNVVAVMDMDGFMVEKRFYCKELGILKIGNIAAQSYFFDIGLEWADLSPKDRRTANYVQNNIHKLPFGVLRGVKAIVLSALEEIVTGVYRVMRKDTSSAIAYKGGRYERDLLMSLGIPSLNLECFGCPKLVDLIEDMVWVETCGRHLVSDACLHCPKVEVEAFGHWLESLL